MMTLSSRWMLSAMLLLLAVPARADAFPDPFPQSTREASVEIESPGHLVLFSPVREINDEIRSETMARLPVTGEGRLYQLARDATRREARDHYLRGLQEEGARILFECENVRCGRSVIWANRVFGQAVLNGRDSEQDYLVAVSEDGDGARWLTLVYTVTRGNLREYVWVEHLRVQPEAVIPGLAEASRRVLGPWVVPWQGEVTYRFDWHATDRRRIRELAEQPGALVVLAGFSALAPDESYESARARAEAALTSLSEVLARTGVSRDRQRLIVVGPGIALSDPERQGNRIEIVVIRR